VVFIEKKDTKNIFICCSLVFCFRERTARWTWSGVADKKRSSTDFSSAAFFVRSSIV